MGDGKGRFESKLSKGWQRFLAHVIEHGLAVGRRVPEDFIRHFPPSAIMEGLKDKPQLRANILIIATGVRPKIAARKTVESCVEDLQIALNEEETDAETVVTLFDPDDRVRFLDAELIWKYVTEGSFWNVDPNDKKTFETAQEHLAFMLERSLRDGLVTHRDIVEGVSVEEMARLLPRDDLARIIAGALKAGHSGATFSEEVLLGDVPCEALVKHIPLPALWERVVVPKISQKYGFEKASDGSIIAAPKTEAPPAADDLGLDALLESSPPIEVEAELEDDTSVMTVESVEAASRESEGRSDSKDKRKVGIPKPGLRG